MGEKDIPRFHRLQLVRSGVAFSSLKILAPTITGGDKPTRKYEADRIWEENQIGWCPAMNDDLHEQLFFVSMDKDDTP